MIADDWPQQKLRRIRNMSYKRSIAESSNLTAEPSAGINDLPWSEGVTTPLTSAVPSDNAFRTVAQAPAIPRSFAAAALTRTSIHLSLVWCCQAAP
jgi:hypothetical protein